MASTSSILEADSHGMNNEEPSPPLKKQKVGGEKEKKIESTSEMELEDDDDSWDTDVTDYETDVSTYVYWFKEEEREKSLSYYRKARKSKGFDAEYPAPPGYNFARPIPLEDHPDYDPKYLSRVQSIKDHSQFALDEYNSRKEKELKLVKILKGNFYPYMLGRYYMITLEAKDANSHATYTYQTRVFHKYNGGRSVEIFRRKPKVLDF